MANDSTQSRIDEIFLDACDVSTARLHQFLDDACGNDLSIRKQVEKLLEADKRLKSDEEGLPAPPLKDFLMGVNRLAEDLESDLFDYKASTRPYSCEQCGAEVELKKSENRQVFVCGFCGGVTRSYQLVESDVYSDVAKLRIESKGRFRVDQVAGEGSFGVVYKAWDSRLRRDVALKIPKGKLVSQKLFVREARAASQLNHQNIVTVFDVNNTDDFAFIVSDFVAGKSLSLWRKSRKLSVRESCELCITIILAMDYAHSKSVVHRDLKPSNIMMDEQGNPKILDFGLSKSLAVPDDGLVTPGTPIGTPAFMSPEQALGKSDSIGPQSDIYSLGIILYQMLTGNLPFSGEDIYADICNVDPKPITDFDNKLPNALNAIVLKSLAKTPEDRYQTAKQFAADLRNFLDGRRVVAYPNIDQRVVIATVKRWSVPSIIVALIVAAIIFAFRARYEYNQNNPTARVVVDASNPETTLKWYRFDEQTGDLQADDPKEVKAGKPLDLSPGFYKVRATANGITNEVFRTVPDENSIMLHIAGMPLKHRYWEPNKSQMKLPKVDLKNPIKDNAVFVNGGRLVTGSGNDINAMYQNLDIKMTKFWISKSELTIDTVRRKFPKLLETSLNFEIVAAYAESVGASIPTVEEYLFLDQQQIEIAGLTTGLKEWTASPLPKIVHGGKNRRPTGLTDRMVISSVSALEESKIEFRSITQVEFITPVPSEQFERNTGFRLVWRN